ncbi:hypothetical protein AYK20_01210 [Thermoplasmatales archaeon SG8-52-1]|nr:MAG: hypothetical protein AYK20_01210 [Thermoplasmatales archaeon SG8-52-1]
MRKRAQFKSKPMIEEPKHIVQKMQPKRENKLFTPNKNWWIALSLIFIFLIILFFNTYYNFTSQIAVNPENEGFSKFYLSGPDPYYNMRLVEETYKSGTYPYYGEPDPLLKYPIGAKGGRPPLLNMMALGFSRLLTPIMSETDAIGYSMQFIPALFGALIIFPVYFIGKELFNKKAAIIGAMLIAIIPIHLSSGHGSAYTLFDHDSFNLLLFFFTFLFLIKSIKEKDRIKQIFYAVLGGVSLAALTMTWVESQYLYVVIAIYAVVQMFIDIFTNKIELKIVLTSSIILFSGYLISLPVIVSRSGFNLTIELFLCIAIASFGVVYYIFGKKKIPWTISIPSIFSVGVVVLIFLYFIENLIKSMPFLSPLKKLSDVIFGTGIYGKKVSMTIAEANTYEISQTVMSFGPSIYWITWLGFILLLYFFYKEKQRRDYLFIIVLFIIDVWLAATAGRFLNDMVPLIAILSGWIVWIFVDWVDYTQMLRNIKSAGGGIHGIRRGVKFLHIFGVIFIAFLVVLPSAFVAFDAAVPTAFTKNRTSVLKIDMFGEDHQGAFGLGVGKEGYWVDAFSWLKEQDTDIKDQTKRPAFISWWDYGFYEVAIGAHPTVADNFQDGIPTAANFHTATSEREAVAIFSIRLLEGEAYFNNDELSNNVQDILVKYVGEDNTEKIKTWIKDPMSSPSYNDPIGAEYDEESSKNYRVGQQYPENAVYHDVIDILLNNAKFDDETNETVGLTDDEITWLYHDLQEETGYSIRYYGVEGYDRSIFNIFGFLADKSLLMINGIEDDFVKLAYKGYTVDSQGNKLSDKTWGAQEILDMSPEDRRYVVITNTQQQYKDTYFDTMFYRVYIGPTKGESGSKEEFDYQLPCLNMKHFYPEYMADLIEYPYYGTGKSSVVIAKYYEGAYLNGTVTFLGQPVDDVQVTVQKNLTYYSDFSLPIDHDATLVDEFGKFNLIAGAGNITLQIRKNVGEGSYILKNVTFNGPNDSEFAPISDDDAMRRNNSNYERNLTIAINPATISGYVYDDIDDDELFNESIDEPLSDVTVTLYRIVGLYQEDETIELDTENAKSFEVNKTGQYHISDLLPGIYRLVVTKGDYNLHLTDVTLDEGDNTYNAPNTKLSALEGVVFIDSNGDDEYDSGDTLLNNVNVELWHEEELVGTYKTDNTGYYSFDSLIPGIINNIELNEYIMKAVKAPDYESELSVYPAENETTIFNISIGLSPVKITGIVTFNGEPVDGAQIDFAIDKSVENNTAFRVVTATIEDGSYDTELTPGYYLVNLTKKDGEGEILLYSLINQNLNISIGQGSTTKNFALEKRTVTVSGVTTYLGFSVDNIEITFEKDISDPEYITASVTSDENGIYTIELPPGNYSIEALSQEFTDDDITYNYKYTDRLSLKETDIKTGIKYDIPTLKVIPE